MPPPLRKIVISALTITGILIVLLGLLAVYSYISMSLVRTDRYYFTDSRMADINVRDILNKVESEGLHSEEGKNRCIQAAFDGHHIEKGNTAVFAYRKFDPGSAGWTDDELFEKITLSFNKLRFDEPIDINSPGVRIFYTRGASAWVGRCNEWFADAADGQITLSRIGRERIKMKLDMRIHTFSRRKPEAGKDVAIHDTMVFRRKDISDITPWLGTLGIDPYEESYRH